MGKVLLWLVGALAFASAAVALFVVVAATATTGAALGAAAGVMIAGPLVLAALLMRSFQRLDSSARFADTAIGFGGIWAALVLAALLIFGRGSLAAALGAVPARHPNLPAPARDAATTVGRWLTPTPKPAPSTPVVIAQPSADAGDAPIRDAGARIVALSDAAPSTSSGGGEPHVFADVAPCEMAFHVAVADFDADGIDEIIVKCIESAHLIGLTTSGTLVELLRFAPEPPPDQKRVAGMPGVGDADGDGRLDLLLCATWTSQKGGTRGGMTWFAPGREGRQFGAWTVFDRSPCNAVAMHDVTGDGAKELLIVNTGNPWQEQNPKGALAWYTWAGGGWKPRGRLPTSVYPDALSFRDLDGDGIDDVVVSHGWSSGDPTVIMLGAKTGLRPAPSTVTVPGAPDRKSARARFDRDGADDKVALDDRGRVQLFRTTAVDKPVIGEILPATP